MCGRYNLVPSPKVTEMIQAIGAEPIEFSPRYNIAPTEPAAIIHDFEGKRLLSDMRWWLTPSWSDEVSTKFSMFNSRSEDIEKSRAFRSPFKKRRGIIPASSFIEWQSIKGKKQPYLIQKDEPLLFAAIWDKWSDETKTVFSCSVVTTAANSELRELHDRMPVMLNEEQALAWLDNETPSEVLLELMSQNSVRGFDFSAIDPTIGNSRVKEAPKLLSLNL